MSQESNCPIARWRRRKEVRPAEILDAALQLFVDKGFKATKMEDIAKAAGVTKGTPYLYFENKEDIFKAVVRENLVTRLAGFAELAKQYDGSSAELLRLMMRRWWQEVGESPLAGICKLMFAEATNFPDLARFYYREVIEPSHNMLLRILERGVASGEFRSLHPHAVVDTLVAPMLLSMTWQCSLGRVLEHDQHRNLPPLDYLEIALDLMLNGLKAD
ncbi:TetR/AcrR family transcriptional regulator [Vogesella sp. LIG4]|uniref:TetR/AcrR family transcriptional regulator n=1 Tax=Vogesella sp. LIG4 TaxID=1192162 RepID=UPI00081FCF9C|nr:TetR/AcrR family transcriptional regulator [Vogesella sp. LIG4]SCK16180.1 transcriptional regulator, TetR family [Vogesella sp. LIG4]